MGGTYQCGLGSPLRNAYHSDTANLHLRKRTKHLLYLFHTISSSPLALSRDCLLQTIAVIEETRNYQGLHVSGVSRCFLRLSEGS